MTARTCTGLSYSLRVTVGVAALAAALTGRALGHEVRVRRPLRVPDILGYRTLQCDFHTHTVFSDGQVWPDVRPEEAWREGFDAVAITDHIEYQPHAADLPTSHERSYEIARPHGEKLDVLVIRGSEITRSMPPGHLNAIFLKSVTNLDYHVHEGDHRPVTLVFARERSLEAIRDALFARRAAAWSGATSSSGVRSSCGRCSRPR